jgi:polysaccharide biosynthesis/export protein
LSRPPVAPTYHLSIPMHSQPLHKFKIAAVGGLFLASGVVAPIKAQTSVSSASNGLPTLSAPTPSAPTPSAPTLSAPTLSAPTAEQPIIPSGPTPESAYTLGAGDIVNVAIFRVPQYSGESQVLVDGTLNLPLIGKVNVNGLGLEEASDVISTQYGQYLRRPIITLSLLSRRPLQIGIAGEVSRPGSYTIDQSDTQSSRLSQLIETAGGITQTADLSQVQVRRPQANGQQQVMTVDLWDLIQNGNLNQDVTLRDGDAVFIPTALVPSANSALLADASFAPDANQPINVAIIGEVYRPGPYTLQGGSAATGEAGTPGSEGRASTTPTTVTRAIQVAGGIKSQADIRKVQVVRPTRAGTPQIFEVDLWQLLEVGDLKQDAVLQEGDTVFVPTATALTPAEISELASASFSPDTIRVNVVGEVGKAGVVELPPNTPMSQAILAAGGFNNRARQGSAELVRLNEDGTVNRSTIPVDFAEGINEENNPLLRNNDVIIVNRSGLASVTDTLGTVVSPLGGLFSIFRFFDIFR